MTQTNVNTGGLGQQAYAVAGTLAGGVNLRAAHSMAIRVRHTSTATTFDSFCLSFSTNGGNASGSYVGRQTGVSLGANGIRFRRYDGAVTDNAVNSTTGYGSTTAWVHLAFVYDTTNIIAYVDGASVGSVASATTFVTSTTNTTFGAGGPHPGVFCDAVIFGRALTAAEVLDLANIRRPKLGRGDCFGWYPEFADGVTTDYSGFGNNLSIIGTGGTNPAASNENPPKAWGGTATFFFLRQGPVAIDGSGNVSVSASAAIKEGVAFTGTGASSVSASATISAATALVGSGQSSVSASAAIKEAVALLGTGASSVSASLVLSEAVAMAGTGQVSVSGSAVVTNTGNGALDGSGNVSVSGAAAISSAASISGQGNSSVSAAGTVGQLRAVDGTGASSVSGSGTVSRQLGLNGIGSCSVSASAAVSVAYALQGTGQVSVSGAGSFFVPGGGVAGDEQLVERRFLGALESRRRLRR